MCDDETVCLLCIQLWIQACMSSRWKLIRRAGFMSDLQLLLLTSFLPLQRFHLRVDRQLSAVVAQWGRWPVSHQLQLCSGWCLHQTDTPDGQSTEALRSSLPPQFQRSEFDFHHEKLKEHICMFLCKQKHTRRFHNPGVSQVWTAYWTKTGEGMVSTRMWISWSNSSDLTKARDLALRSVPAPYLSSLHSVV